MTNRSVQSCGLFTKAGRSGKVTQQGNSRIRLGISMHPLVDNSSDKLKQSDHVLISGKIPILSSCNRDVCALSPGQQRCGHGIMDVVFR